MLLQVASVNRGLDRCAALLTSLLAPDNTSKFSMVTACGLTIQARRFVESLTISFLISSVAELLPQQPKALVVSKEQLNGAEQIHRHGNVEKGKSLSSKLKTQTDGSSRPPEIRTVSL